MISFVDLPWCRLASKPVKIARYDTTQQHATRLFHSSYNQLAKFTHIIHLSKRFCRVSQKKYI